MIDYEKKYKEALERANSFQEKYGGDYAGYIFPELRESEDEKIRKFLIDYFTSYKIGNVATKLNGYRIDDILAYLEKQKENPKSADSISSDCMSDVRCEDRWHKVTDSLPDNGRLVLAKDCLGNVLLARYDGENWEVNVYDNEDHYCHNSISKWCEIPSEKQKEQKPAEWSEEDEDMLNSCISSIEEAKENRYAYKETDGDTSYDHEIAWLKLLRNRVGKEFLQPHWKPSEGQMRALLKVVDKARELHYSSNSGYDEYDVLRLLYKQLKEL